MFEIKNDAPERTDSEVPQPEERDTSRLALSERPDPEYSEGLSDGGENDGKGNGKFHPRLAPAEQQGEGHDAGDGVDPVSERIQSIDNSDMTPDEKRSQYEQLKRELQDTQRPDQGSFDVAEDGAPVRVLKLGGSDMGRSHPDYEQELMGLDEGVRNMEDYYQSRASDINSRNEQISSSPDLTNAEKIAELKNNRDELRHLSDMGDRDYADVYSERDRLGKLVPQDENY